jgi:hemerythrin-like domain-containing protein
MKEMNDLDGFGESRRQVLRAGLSLAGASLIGGSSLMANTQPGRPDEHRRTSAQDEEGHEEGKAHKEEEINPGEDLMREHGVLKRIMLVYDEAERRLLSPRTDVSPDAIHQSASLIRSFIEDYHEKLEEDHLFPRYRKANRLVDLVDVLTTQHQAGRKVTEHILQLATNSALKDEVNRKQLATMLGQFNRMYAPHEAREDTVLFPALRKIVTPNEYDALGEDFERKEHELFGEGGFEEIVEKVATIEKGLGIYDLAQFTPKI